MADRQALVRPEWLASTTEPAIEADLPIVDYHHHLWDRPGWPYLLPEFLDDLGSGHRVLGTVYVQGRAMLRAAAPEPMRPVGETEFANGVAAMSASGIYGSTAICAGIVGFADLTRGGEVDGVLEAHVRAGGGRFRGIRQITAWSDDPALAHPSLAPRPRMASEPAFREGFACLERHGLSFDAWVLHGQLDEIAELAASFPRTPIVVDHLGTPTGVAGWQSGGNQGFADWAAALRRVGRCPNVHLKIGGLGMPLCGFGFEHLERPRGSAELAHAWQPYVDAALDAFGPARCMFEANFPVDKVSYGYAVFWNACKILTRGLPAADRAALLAGNAARFYRLELPGAS